jgi:hypothetical protein
MDQANKDLMARLADRGEQVVGRITDLPGAKTLVDSVASLTKQLNDTQRRLRTLDPLERRVTALEKRLERMEGEGSTAKRTTARKTSATAKPASKRTTAPRKPPGSSSGSSSGASS